MHETLSHKNRSKEASKPYQAVTAATPKEFWKLREPIKDNLHKIEFQEFSAHTGFSGDGYREIQSHVT